MSDLVLLVSDKNMQGALRGALARSAALGIRPITTEFIVHSGRDGGVRTSGPGLLALKRRTCRHALLLLDHEGSGTTKTPTDLEHDLDESLQVIWGDAAKAIVISPELDVWMWGSDNVLQEVLGWTSAQQLRPWLRANGFAFTENGKPERPKEAMERVMRELRQPRSSSLYEEIASRISLSRCKDPAFQRLRNQLQQWFPTG